MMNQSPRQSYEFGPFRLDAQERLLQRDGATIALTPKAFDLLLALVERHGRLVEKEELFQAVWPDTIVEESNLSSNIALIRKALNDGENGLKFIETVPKRGYRFVAEVREVQPAPVEPEPAAIVPASPLPTPLPSGKARHWQRPALIVAGSVIALFVVWAGWRFLAPRISPLPPAKIVPFTSLPGNERQPSFSPDGNQLVFAWDGAAGDNTDLYVKQIGNEALVRLTTDPAADVTPCWSPDGRSIAFVREQPAGAGLGAGLYIIPSLGGAERRLTELTANSGAPPFISWSPDGNWLAASDRGAPGEAPGIFLIARATGEKRRLTTPPAGVAVSDSFPAFSPDSRRLVFGRSFGALVNDLFVVPVAGGEPQRLTFDNTSVRSPVWTSDGREILFISWREGGAPGLWRILATGGTPEKVEAAVRNPFNLALAPQGHRLALTDDISDKNIWRLELPNLSAGAGGKEPLQAPKPLIASTMFDANPRYSPDGKRIAFMSNRTGSQEIWLADSNGDRPVALTAFNRMGAGSVYWSPDGSQLAFDARPEGNADIYALNVEDRKLRRLTNDAAEDTNPSWSRDGKWVYFRSTRSGDRRIWKVPAAGGDAVQVTQQVGHDGVESPDGQFLYFTKGRNVPGIWQMPVAGGEATLVLDHHGVGIWRHWTVTEAGIYFATEAQPKQTLIECFSFATRQVRCSPPSPKGLIAQRLECPFRPMAAGSSGRNWISRAAIFCCWKTFVE